MRLLRAIRARLRAAIFGPEAHITAPDGTYWLAWADGRHDDTSALQAAIDRGRGIGLPAGHYKVRTLVVPRGAGHSR